MIKAMKLPYNDVVRLELIGGMSEFSKDLSRVRRNFRARDIHLPSGGSRRVIYIREASRYTDVDFIRCALEDADRQILMFEEVP